MDEENGGLVNYNQQQNCTQWTWASPLRQENIKTNLLLINSLLILILHLTLSSDTLVHKRKQKKKKTSAIKPVTVRAAITTMIQRFYCVCVYVCARVR